jgi:hypothetical protein
MEGRYSETDDTKPMWIAEGLKGYAPGSPPAPIVELDAPKRKTA